MGKTTVRYGGTAAAWVTLAAACAFSATGCVATSAQNTTAGPSAASSNQAAATASASAAPAATATAAPATNPPVSTAPQPGQTDPPGPTLGTPWESGLIGYGQVEPSEVDDNTGADGIVTGITWSSWGQSTATGTGTAEYIGGVPSATNGTEQPTTVVAFNLGTCGGKQVYTAFTWYFPELGQQFTTSMYVDACDGFTIGDG